MTLIYSKDVLRLAVQSADYPPLAAADARVRMRTPVCGSQISLDVQMDGTGCVAAVGMTIHACAVGQASAALFAGSVVGRSVEDISAAAEQLAYWLSDETHLPPPWPDIEMLAPARLAQPRHAAIMLAFNAGLRAAEAAQAGAGDGRAGAPAAVAP